MRIIFMGNPDFAIPSLEKIIQSKNEVVAVVSNPEKRMGRGKKRSHTPVGAFAVKNDIKLITPTSLNDPDFLRDLSSLKPDLNIVVAYRILPLELIQLPRFGSVNLHASLLPKYRGAAPIQWSLINGDRKTGVSTFFIERKVDTGKLIEQKEVPITDNDDFESLSRTLSTVGSEVILNTIHQIDSGQYSAIPQDESQTSRAPKISKEMTWIRWDNPAEKIANLIRGLSPKPGMVTTIFGKKIRLFSPMVIHRKSENCQNG